MENKIEIIISIQFDSEDELKIIFTSLKPEIQEHDFERSQVSFSLKNLILTLNIKAQDMNAAKATINSVLGWISTTTGVLNSLSKQT
jgi:tRNA threonylcarbamoyladenosine modification (KEOPS) complex  Pcc1 subunit